MQIPLIKEARNMGRYIIVLDRNEHAEGMELADIPVCADIKNTGLCVDECMRIRKKIPEYCSISGVLTVGTDFSTTVAAIAAALGLPGINFDCALCAKNKILMRRCFAEKSCPQPRFCGADNLEEASVAVKDLPFPLVIKPADNMGARGVKRVDTIAELQDWFPVAEGFAHTEDTEKKVIIEEYISGSELSIDALIYDNEIFITGVADRIIRHEPYFIEIGHIMPSQLAEEQTSAAVYAFKQGIRALGIRTGMAKGDIKINEKGAFIGEIAARLSGGYMSGYTYPYATGVNLMRNAVRIAENTPPSGLTPSKKWCSIERAIIAPKEGIIRQINGIDKVKKLSGIKNVFLFYTPGQYVKLPQNNVEKGGNIIAAAPSYAETLNITENALQNIRFEY